MADDRKKDLADAYDKVVEANEAFNKEREEHAQKLKAAQAQQQEAEQKRQEASHQVTKDKRDRKSEESQHTFDEKLKQAKGTMKGYDTMLTSLMELAELNMAMSKSLNADMWAVLAGPLSDTVYEKGLMALKSPYYLARFAVDAAYELNKYPELLKIAPDMIRVTDSGELEFKSFTEFQKKGRDIPPEQLRMADIAMQSAVTYLVKKEGYEYRPDEGVYVKEDGTKLNQEALEHLVKSSDLNALMETTLKEKPPAPDLDSDPEAAPAPSVRH